MRAITAAVLLAVAATPALAADPVEGEWLTHAGTGKVRIGPCPSQPGRLCGAISWLKNPADATATDNKNPDPKLKTRTIMGMPMLWGFKPAGPGKWTGGKIYDPESGKTYDSKLSVNANGTLKVEGCVVMICQAQTWKRG
jgi:uncharacterized protein (DUF2147 family)